MSKSLHAVLSNGAEDEGISLNTYIVTLLSERHIEKKLMNKIEAIQNLIKVANSKRISGFINSSQPTHKIEGNKKKYRSKKTKK